MQQINGSLEYSVPGWRVVFLELVKEVHVHKEWRINTYGCLIVGVFAVCRMPGHHTAPGARIRASKASAHSGCESKGVFIIDDLSRNSACA